MELHVGSVRGVSENVDLVGECEDVQGDEEYRNQERFRSFICVFDVALTSWVDGSVSQLYC